ETAAYSAVVTDPVLSRYHRVHVGGLTPDTVYHFEITAMAKDGLSRKSGDRQFRTLKRPPFILNVRVRNITQSSADILWETDRPTTGVVDYGETAAYSAVVTDPVLSRYHRVHVGGLTPDTVYHFEITATAKDGLSRKSGDRQFRTLKPRPPVIRNIRVKNITQNSADVSWDTDQPTTGLVDFGETTAYGRRRLDPVLSRSHQVHLSQLVPHTDYHFRITATDAFGQRVSSADRLFRTLKPPPPVIRNIQVANITQSSADISWETDRETTGVVRYGATPALGLEAASRTVGRSHSVHLSGLDWGTLYYFRILATDAYDQVTGSSRQTFRTLEPPPLQISGIQVINITRDSADILWETNRASFSFVDYGRTRAYGETVLAPTFAKRHRVHLSGLEWGALYHFRITAVDRYALVAFSPDQTFETVQPAPPVIFDIQVTDIGRTSATIRWKTDKPTTDVVAYGPTVAYGSTGADPTLSRSHHVQLTGLAPDTEYHFRITATDVLGLTAQSPDQTFRTKPGWPKAPRLAPEPEFTKGTENRLSWSGVEFAVLYRLEVARNPAFPSPRVVETTGRSATVTGLADGVTHYYRVAGVNAVGVQGGYSNVEHSTQDASPPETSCELLAAPTAVAPGAGIELKLHAFDATSGVKHLLLYFAKDRGPFRQHGGRLDPATATVRFDLEPYGAGHYAFYTIGVDNVGNREAAPTTPDVQVDVRIPTTLTYVGDAGTTTGVDALFAAVLVDAFGDPVSGATIDYALDGLHGSLSPTDAAGLAQQLVNVGLLPGLYDLTLTFAGNGALQGSSATVQFVVKPVVEPPGPQIDVKALGTVIDAAGKTFAFDIEVSNQPLGGLMMVNTGSDLIGATQITSVNLSGGVAVITGIASVNNTGAHRFVVRVTDGSPDRFGLTTTEGTFVGLTDLATGSVTIGFTP
ncbi:MAG: fibronectin type III domain-containing protein, partial [Armatimonadetes bacterium]|nr:fibronectin type III domain-containing protein [Armatimonadota bacterium]